jgi:integrase
METMYEVGGRHAVGIAAYTAARRAEVKHLRYRDLRRSSEGYHYIRIYEDGAKRGEYREAPIPRWLVESIRGENDPDEHIVDVTMRTIDNRLSRAADELRDDSDEAWAHLSMHDLRRTAINAWLDDDVPPLLVMQWSGHDDWRTFRDHYLQTYSEQKQAEVLSNIDW